MCMNEISTLNFYLAAVILCSPVFFDLWKSITSLPENFFPSVFKKLLASKQYGYRPMPLVGYGIADSVTQPGALARLIAKLLQNNIYQTIKQQSGFAAIVRCTHTNSLTIN